MYKWHIMKTVAFIVFIVSCAVGNENDLQELMPRKQIGKLEFSYVGDFLRKVPHHFLKHSRLSSLRYTQLDTLLVLVTSLKKRYSIVFSSSSPKNFQKWVLLTMFFLFKVFWSAEPFFQKKVLHSTINSNLPI